MPFILHPSSFILYFTFHPNSPRNGTKVTINTDDPGISGIDLPYEYNVAAPKAGLSEEQIRQAQKNALEIAFLAEDEKTGLVKKKRSKGNLREFRE